jgi:hypothetical protein
MQLKDNQAQIASLMRGMEVRLQELQIENSRLKLQRGALDDEQQQELLAKLQDLTKEIKEL